MVVITEAFVVDEGEDLRLEESRGRAPYSVKGLDVRDGALSMAKGRVSGVVALEGRMGGGPEPIPFKLSWGMVWALKGG